MRKSIVAFMLCFTIPSLAFAGRDAGVAAKAGLKVLAKVRDANGGQLPSGVGSNRHEVVGKHFVLFQGAKRGRAPSLVVASALNGGAAPEHGAVLRDESGIVARFFKITESGITREETLVKGPGVTRSYQEGGAIKTTDYRGYIRSQNGDRNADPFAKVTNPQRGPKGRFSARTETAKAE